MEAKQPSIYQHLLASPRRLGVKLDYAERLQSETQDTGLSPALQAVEERIRQLNYSGTVRRKGQLYRYEIERIEALKHDQELEELPALVQLEDVGLPMHYPEEQEAAIAYFQRIGKIPEDWRLYLNTGREAPHGMKRLSFIHQFSEPEPGNDLVVMLDLYRPPWKPYFASDVFFMHWIKANVLWRGEDTSVFRWEEVPEQLPRTLYINNVSHIDTLTAIRNILPQGQKDFAIPCSGNQWETLRHNPHVKLVEQVVQTFNLLAASRGTTPCALKTLRCFGKGSVWHLKFDIQPY